MKTCSYGPIGCSISHLFFKFLIYIFISSLSDPCFMLMKEILINYCKCIVLSYCTSLYLNIYPYLDRIYMCARVILWELISIPMAILCVFHLPAVRNFRPEFPCLIFSKLSSGLIIFAALRETHLITNYNSISLYFLYKERLKQRGFRMNWETAAYVDCVAKSMWTPDRLSHMRLWKIPFQISFTLPPSGMAFRLDFGA